MTPRRTTSLRPGQFKHLIRVASVTGRLPERDVALLWLTHPTDIRVTELAMLEVADVLYPSGAIKPEVYLRADITKGCRPRNIYLTHAKCLAALDAWLLEQQTVEHEALISYRGLTQREQGLTDHEILALYGISTEL